MTISNAFEMATNAEFKELSNFSLPPRAGRVTAIEASGQVRVASDDPDGGDVLAWPLNGFTYAVNDVVYILFAGNSPDSAIVLGARSPVPALTVGDPLEVNIVRARSAAGVRLEDDAGTLGVFVEDGGDVGIGTDAPTAKLHVLKTTGGVDIVKFTGANGSTLIDQYGNFFATGLNAEAGLDATGVVSLKVKKTDGNGKDWRIEQGRNTSDGSLEIMNGEASSSPRAVVQPGGNWGFGTTSPQGRIHAHTGTGGMIFVTKTGITNVLQTIIPNGTGDVTGGLAALIVANDGTGAVMTTLLMALSTTSDVTVGALTLRFTLAASGALTVVRQAGIGTATLALLAVWL
jgi:hypothetical protein